MSMRVNLIVGFLVLLTVSITPVFAGDFNTKPSSAIQNQNTLLQVITINNFIDTGCPVHWYWTEPDGSYHKGEEDVVKCCRVGGHYDEAYYDFPKIGTYEFKAEFPASGNCDYHVVTWDIQVSPGCDNDGNCESSRGETQSNCPNDCQCDSGQVCCSSDNRFLGTSYICDSSYDSRFVCKYGEDPGDDVFYQVDKRYCSGNSGGCTGRIEPQNPIIWDRCDAPYGCEDGKNSCQRKYYCGDGSCNNGETYSSCPSDCPPPCTADWKCKDSNTWGYQNGACSWSSLTTCSIICVNSVGCSGFVTNPSTATQYQDTLLEVVIENNFINTGCPVHWYWTEPDGSYHKGEEDVVKCCRAGGHYDDANFDFPQPGTYEFKAKFPASGNCDQYEVTWDIQVSPVCDNDGNCETGETQSNCPNDCGCDNDGKCESNRGETHNNCPNDCPCDSDGSCDSGENEQNCATDCGCDNDGNCEPIREEDNSNCPNDCIQGCSLPNGSSEDCDCDTNADCPSGYYCNDISGWDACEIINYADECSNYNDYFCEDGWVMKCIDTGTHWEKTRIESCTGKYEYCDSQVVDGTRSCSEYPNHLEAWIDHADSATEINKQRGDKLKLNINSEQTTTVNIDYDPTIFEGNCPIGSFNVVFGVNTCNLAVKSDAALGKTKIKVEDKVKIIDIDADPDLLVITDSIKLHHRFPYESNGVKAVLKQAYANAEDDGVVYDLSWYSNELGVSNPFPGYNYYYEKITNPSMTNNSYSLAVSDFVKEKCKNCKDVMIVGDDFVVPGYRNEFVVDYSWSPAKENHKTHEIYTDQNYITVQGLPQINELDIIFTQKGRRADKQVMFIVPDLINSTLRNSIDNLKNVIKTKFQTDDIPEKKGSELIIGDYGVPGTTLVIIGDLDTNPALRYYPFAISKNYSMYIDRNLWDPNRGFLQKEEYALIMKIDSAYELDLNAGLIESELYREIKGEGINWIALVGGGLLVVASPFTGPAAPFVAAAGIVILSADTVDNCLIENQGGQNWDECGGDIAIDVATVGIFKVVKPFAKPLVQKLGKAAGEQVISRISKFGKYINPKAIEKVAKEGDELVNMKHISDGVELVTRNSLDSSDLALERAMKQFPSTVTDTTKVRVIKIASKSNEALDINPSNLKGVRFVKGTHEAFEEGGYAVYDLGGNKLILVNTDVPADKLIKNVIHHEFSHAYVNQKMGKKIWTLVGDSIANTEADKKLYVYQLNEYLAERVSKEKIPGHVFSSVIDNHNNYDTVKNHILTGDLDYTAKIFAETKIQNINLYNQIKNQLISEGHDITKVLQLSDKYIEASDELLQTGIVSTSKINEVAQLTKEILDW